MGQNVRGVKSPDTSICWQTVNSSQLFHPDELTERLPDVFDQLISGVKGIRHLSGSVKEPNICSTTTKLRKSLIKPVMWQKTCIYIELFGFPPEIVMHDYTFNVYLRRYMRRA